MYLGFSLTPFGHHPAAWRRAADIENLGFEALLSQVARAEQAGLDFVLLADRLGARPVDDLSPVATAFEPTTLVAALATRVRRIGFVAAAATHQHEPYNLARRFASLESISHGRTGWVAVTSDDEGRDREYIDLVGALWDSWEDDAFIYDKENGRFFQPDKMHVLNHKGEHFSVRGPLNVNRSPQGKPVLAQILTDESRALAAHAAELVFLQSSSPSLAEEAAADFVKSLDAGKRSRTDTRILANVSPFIAGMRAEALALHDALQADGDGPTQPLSGANLIGTPIDIADLLQQWFETGHIDGFTILPPTSATGDLFLSEVAPELQRRGLTGKPKGGSTLRHSLGLSRPTHPAALERAS
ncbi:flavin-dependent oxidoreductase, F420-dependent methylene-tetrahydromethanopterin reductase [Rhizobium leguminosarum bv. trifolii WSM2297]|uniref:Flavin-dependent oxidoreductase, F420-dependent methylene-tetrahydromethanopterin reductase n=1 Tax=Rhizobium leguminosarum bv. trifolii WSM2297 TaxID=754762 RepID=J0CT77_RHILT|nr:LLM class flavin-dependent oxidoreductase [Rhizobium leguminosarum]EJC83030.1 flavin-dependent oxidoreductase, F420-dependent methylene-tetrahydromethanopterin reductase [Rhizobium leguminosarum bv. trifolii WSM2297]